MNNFKQNLGHVVSHVGEGIDHSLTLERSHEAFETERHRELLDLRDLVEEMVNNQEKDVDLYLLRFKLNEISRVKQTRSNFEEIRWVTDWLALRLYRHGEYIDSNHWGRTEKCQLRYDPVLNKIAQEMTEES